MTTMYTYQIGDQTIDYTVEVVPNRTDISVQVSDKNQIKVIVPKGLNRNNVLSVLSRKSSWILTQLSGAAKVAEKKESAPVKRQAAAPAAKTATFENDEKFFYLGRQYRLNIVQDDVKEPSMTFRSKFIATVPSNWNTQQTNEGIQAMLTDWYTNRASEKFAEALKAVSEHVQAPSNVEWADITDLTKKEGDTLHVNWRVLMAPMATIEYVVASALTNNVDGLYDDAAERKQWLTDNNINVF